MRREKIESEEQRWRESVVKRARTSDEPKPFFSFFGLSSVSDLATLGITNQEVGDVMLEEGGRKSNLQFRVRSLVLSTANFVSEARLTP